MKNSKLTLVLGFVLMISYAYGQDYAFRVLASKGSNEVKSGDTWEPIKTGANLQSTDELKVGENAYLGLVHAKGKPIEIKKAGPYKVADLAASIGAGTSVLNKYTDFILSSNSAEAKKNRLSATGAVHRGLEDIKVYLPENQNSGVFKNTAVINWGADKTGAAPYLVTLKNMFDDELMKIETSETSVSVNLDDPKLSNESAILVEVKSKADPKIKSEQHLIKRLSAAEKERVTKAFAEIQSDVTEETALNEFIKAGFYEENKLFIDAISSYEQAIKLAPDVQTYKDAYEEFLLRNKLKTPKN